MTLKDINADLAEIEAKNYDNEAAHIAEDALHQAFISYVATLKDHNPELAAKADLVLKSKEIEFDRWYL